MFSSFLRFISIIYCFIWIYVLCVWRIFCSAYPSFSHSSWSFELSSEIATFHFLAKQQSILKSFCNAVSVRVNIDTKHCFIKKNIFYFSVLMFVLCFVCERVFVQVDQYTGRLNFIVFLCVRVGRTKFYQFHGNMMIEVNVMC